MDIHKVRELWEKFGDITVDNDDAIQQPFLFFPVGTDKLEVWEYFDSITPNGLAIDLLNYEN